MKKKISEESSISLADIVSRLKADDARALDLLYDRYYFRLYRFCKGLIKLEDEVDDILQNVFLKIWLNRFKITTAETFTAYIFTITKNAVVSFIRAHEKDIKLRMGLQENQILYDFETESKIEYEEMEQKVNSLLEQLPETTKTIYEFSRKQGLSNKEISNKLGVSVKTVEYHITKTLKVFKENLKDFGLISLLLFEIFY